MLRYIEQLGLVAPMRSAGGYRLYGPDSLQRLRTLRELIAEHDLGLGDLGLALRLRRDPELRRAVDSWLDSEPTRPVEVASAEWLRWEQDKHQALLSRLGAPVDIRSARPSKPSPDVVKETA